MTTEEIINILRKNRDDNGKVILTGAAQDIAQQFEQLRAERDELKEELQKVRHTNRWNVIENEDCLRVCYGGHHRSEKCDYHNYVPEPELATLQAENEQLRAIVEKVREMRKAENDLYADPFDESIEAYRKVENLKEEVDQLLTPQPTDQTPT